MLSAEQNDFITRVGPGAPAGTLLRKYWQPVALAEELQGPRPLRPVKLMGQNFVLFRDENGKLGMLDRDCPHRGADLAFGRLEDGGLRCPFHGWLFDAQGNCLETPAEPAGSKLCTRIKQAAYPVVEKSGIIFAYIGEDEPPAFPDFDCFVAPDSHTFAFKGLWECNWLQALEVGMDPAHASFLHRFFEDEDTSESYGKQFRGASADSELAITQVLREYDRPEIRVNPAPYGMQLTTLRTLSDTQTHVRVTNVIFPQAFVIPMSTEMTISQWHVPVDDTHCYWYAIFTSFAGPVDKQQMREQRLATIELPDYISRKNKRNNYGYNVEEQLTQTYTGMGMDINVHDQWACESLGPIQNRTREHLGTTDKGIIAYRRMLVGAIEAALSGEAVPMQPNSAEAAALYGPPSIDGVAEADRTDAYCEEADLLRRRGSDWASARLQA
ncbi:aromatic ring-hydroxylating dioxygenase subunit alpha [Kerstersia gyiorum]|uniref:Dioxygenase n=1 Tax=Kerstersia gyiorum TaxID=206506 RepID=A0A171KP28_9BURK|nr:aromatic ring-hydroxylating dioxygenase subunit alpha [Kerstersia gyiorum]MCO7637907.1 aromatic ring-hydroxylating dioxygenase subunit alpha [Pseudomonas sp. S 311-6]KKO70645.1 dioxygenase [Kerstersia gyiorum]MCP1634009.1 nitrite reductase/ring-hydroxylating ferredoxin subunit [Kerstersia gyiorum]MCP1637330.1 nitrite reductase/ring-hydroxylating ferredoxin subunit [Kerstersia gyiorum]MCP1671876.1 nitrite reductase/ring-hydroxylating ferredoxin subunit [Kerstersia gyiorum]